MRRFNNLKTIVIFQKIPGFIYLWTAMFVFAASSSITRKITELGRQHLIEGRNPISSCNVLFVGNICALLIMIAIFHGDWRKSVLTRISRKEWLILSLVAILSSALVPLLIFSALNKTTVTSVVILTRLEPSLSLALYIIFLKERVHFLVIIGSLITFSGVIVTLLLKAVVFSIGQGEMLALTGAIILSIGSVIIKGCLNTIPLGIFFVYRNLLGTLVFFLIAKIFYPPEHFIDAFSPFLWSWMLVYAAVIVVVGQLSNLKALRECSAAQISLASSVNPLLAVIIAYFILGEIPTFAQYIGGFVILIGIIVSLFGTLSNLPPNMKITTLDQMQEQENSHQLKI